MGELTLPQALDRDPDFRTTAENLMADEIERLQLSLSHARAESLTLMRWKRRWKRRWDDLAKILEDPENTFDHADQVLEVMDAMESRVNPDD